MRTEADLTVAMGRRARAEALLQNELLNESFATLEKEYMKAWKETTLANGEAREQIWYMVANLHRFRAHLTTIINDGKLAQRELEDITKLGKLNV